ncbi:MULTISPECIES: YciC family protein [Pseudomonas]|uniref:YciC family protein n=1 Tax=Pseudomonas TaxID=286 RepID=UPI001C608DE8|nr:MULTISPECIES: YciC family protein [Pseudomonas]MBW5414741.1 hypothetical protein [Pseudomonas sp. MAG002Y]MCG7373831.1 hypothetical protein [Pseudomonas luteola]
MTPFNILRDALYFFSRHLVSLLILCLPWLIIESVARWQVVQHFGTEGGLWELLVGVMFYPIYTGSLILFLNARSHGHMPPITELWGHALRLWPRFAIMAGLVASLVVLGFSLMIVPGFLVMVKFAFAEPMLVLRGMAPLEAMSASFQKTRGHFLTLLPLILITLLPAWLLDAWISSQFGDTPALQIILQSLSGLLQLISSIAIFRLFMMADRSS